MFATSTKPGYNPVTLTLETYEEYTALLTILKFYQEKGLAYKSEAERVYTLISEAARK